MNNRDDIATPDPLFLSTVFPIYHHRWLGVAIAFSILILWLSILIVLLRLDTSNTAWWISGSGVAVLTFLYTGLFITAHDAMHGLVHPGNRFLNETIGSLALLLFALFSFRRVRIEHWRHHSSPATENDPDFHDLTHTGFLRWYSRFLLHYASAWQLAGMAIAYNFLHLAFLVPQNNLIVFWILPNLLSTIQLFTFGTFLPHKRPPQGYDNPHRARSSEYRPILSFLACYHFGYHYEHHRYPFVPWWALPGVRRRMIHLTAANS